MSVSIPHAPSRTRPVVSFCLSPITPVGELPLEIITMKAKGCSVSLGRNKPGFTLPSNIGELGADITKLDLIGCSLRGACRTRPVVSLVILSELFLLTDSHVHYGRATSDAIWPPHTAAGAQLVNCRLQTAQHSARH